MSLEEFSLVDDQLRELRAANQRLAAQVRRYKARSDELAEAVYQAAADARKMLPAVKPPRTDRRRRGMPEVALWHLTDWQLAKKTASYDPAICRSRVHEFCERAFKISEIHRADHAVKDCWILFGGDMLEGLFNFPTQAFEINATLFEQLFLVGDLLGEVVLSALAGYERVTVVSEWGNHGRIGSKRAVVPRSDNLDRMAYEHARRMLAGQPRLTWHGSDEDVQRVEIGEYRALLIHGDEIGRNGYASRKTIVDHVNRWRSGAYPWTFQDAYVGHYHVHGEEQLADGVGAVFWTGSTESDNRYARDGLASGGKPSQRLHFIEPTKGIVTAQYKVRLA